VRGEIGSEEQGVSMVCVFALKSGFRRGSRPRISDREHSKGKLEIGARALTLFAHFRRSRLEEVMSVAA
jgi:hypothetical protein